MNRILKTVLLGSLTLIWLVPAQSGSATGAASSESIMSAGSKAGPTLTAACRMVRKVYPCYRNQQRCRLVTKCVPWQRCRLTPRGRVCTTTRKCWQVRRCRMVRVRMNCWRTYRVCD